MAKNKVIFGDTTIMDITDTTAEAADVADGKVFYGNDGVRAVGTGNYMDKVSNPTANDILVTDANGQAVDSGVGINDVGDTKLFITDDHTGAEISSATNSRESVTISYDDTDDDIKLDIGNSGGYSRFALATTGNIPTMTSDLTNDGDGTNNFVTFGDEATSSEYGVIKLNPNESVDVNANGQLTVGGRLGQFPNGGVFYPTTIEPTNVGASTFMMTDGAKNLSLAGRHFGIMAGAGITCKSASAGATEYRVSNTQGNRFALFAVKGGRAAIDQTDAMNNGTALITSIKFANGNDISAYYGPTESSNDIIVTLDRTINPSAATTKMRVYGTSVSSDVIVVGQGCGAQGGKVISLGQSCFASGNQNIAFGNSSIVTANNSVSFGHTNLVNKQFCFAAGQGHDFTNGNNGAGAVGIASEIGSNTAFAVGNGVFNANGNITRSNALEVTTDGGLVLKSPNGTKFKITVDNSGNLTTTAI